jgi:molybdopterin-guanine dinucleotide biosynthesis protein A
MVDNPRTAEARIDGSVLGVILAGGAALRMGGGDKCLQPIGGMTALAHILGRLVPQVDQVLLNANGDPARFSAYGLEVIADGEADQGPVAGVLAGLTQARARGHALCLTVPGDAPLLPRDLAARLQRAMQDGKACCAVAASGGRRQNAFALWRTSVLPEAQRLYAGGMRALWRLQTALDAAEAPFAADENGGFAGFNRREDLAALATALARAER